jgi:hypothetical protein
MYHILVNEVEFHRSEGGAVEASLNLEAGKKFCGASSSAPDSRPTIDSVWGLVCGSSTPLGIFFSGFGEAF